MFDLERVVKKYQLTEEEQLIVKALVVDESQREAISQFDQRTPEWHAARLNRLTASRFGSARGHCQYTSQTELLKGMLWNDFEGNAAMKWGVDHEANAVEVYKKFMMQSKNLTETQFVVTHCGLLVSLDHPWIGVSVDAFVFDDSEPDPARKRGGAEIKCPYGKKLYPYIPSMYYDQIQGSAGVLHLPWWDFCVWTPVQTQIRRFNFDPVYFNQELFPRLESFYFHEYLPRAVLKNKGLLKPGKIDPTIEIDVPISDPKESSSSCSSASSAPEPQHVEVECASRLLAAKPINNKGQYSLKALFR